MQLLLTKGQSKGLLGSVKFEVKAQVQLTDEEQELIRHYNLQYARVRLGNRTY